MKINAQTVIELLLHHQSFFFRLLDEMDKHKGVLPLAFYRQQVQQESSQIADLGERQRWKSAMSLDNLDWAGLLLSLDRHYGTMKWKDFVVDMFRHFDKSRLRSLSDPQLKMFVSQLNAIQQNLVVCSLDKVKSPAFRENIDLTFDILHDIHHRIRENSESLQQRASHLADIVDNFDVSSLAENERRQQALAEIRHLYERVILPTLSFLNEDEKHDNGHIPLKIMSQIAECLAQMQENTLARQVINIKNSIRSFFKDIDITCQQMLRYVKQSDSERQKYDVIESLFNGFYQRVAQRYDGKFRSPKILLNELMDEPFLPFRYLKSRKSDSRINWQTESQSTLFDEYLRVHLQSQAEQKAARNVYVEIDPQKSLQAQRQKQHIEALQLAMRKFPLPAENVELQPYLHQYLQQQLDDYRLLDLIDGINWIKMLFHPKVRIVFGLKLLSYKQSLFRYHPIYLEKNNEHSI